MYTKMKSSLQDFIKNELGGIAGYSEIGLLSSKFNLNILTRVRIDLYPAENKIEVLQWSLGKVPDYNFECIEEVTLIYVMELLNIKDVRKLNKKDKLVYKLLFEGWREGHFPAWYMFNRKVEACGGTTTTASLKGLLRL